MSREKKKTRVKFPISVKLVIIISILVLVSLGTVTFMVSVLSSQDVQIKAEDNNYTINRRAGSQAESFFKSIGDTTYLYLEMTDQFSPVPDTGRDARIRQHFFGRNRHIAAIGAGDYFIPNDQFFVSGNISPDAVKKYFSSELPAVADRIRLFNASPEFRQPLICAVYIHRGDTGEKIIKVLFSPDELSESFGSGANTSFIVTDTGGVLLHPDEDLVLGGANFSSLPIVAAMQQGKDKDRRQISFTNTDGEKYFGAYSLLAGTDAAVITTISHNIVFEAVRAITVQNLFLTAAVLFSAILFIWFFSKTISGPVRILAEAALLIEGGQFDVSLKPKTRDELGLLTNSFSKMSSALNIFGRFTNKDIAVRAMRGEIKPGGLPKQATIFFSDIRGFTDKSEKFTNAFGAAASNRIVMWLNEYFTYMVDCVEKTGGVVDKFIGDAVMAHWGTAFTGGSPEADAFNCVKSALMMRNALIKLNARREKNDPGNPVIQIGCGINTGVVTAGQIGSEQRMEYTVIGDPVNLASRTEALNKPLGTDILITENTWLLTGDKLITEEMPPVTVKGKEKPIRMFAVVNMKNVAGPKTLAELRSLLSIPTPNLSKADTDGEETKYKIHGA